MKLLRVTKNVIDYYREHVKGNKNDDVITIRKKITRNVLLGRRAEPPMEGKELYFYGNLQILVKGNKVVWLKNGDKKLSKIDYSKKAELDMMLGIK